MDTITRTKTGFIGYGSMGSMLAESFLRSGTLAPDQIIMSTRDTSRCDAIIRQYPAITIARDNRDLVQKSSRIILGVKPLDILPVLKECADLLDSRNHIISLAACVQIRNMEEIWQGRITRILPSLVNRTGAGCILCCHNAQVCETDARDIESFFGKTGDIIPIREDQFEAAGDLMSCAPALLAAMAEEFALAGVRHSTLSHEQATRMAYATLFGTGLLLEQKMPVADIISRVATRGGITEEGVHVLRDELPPVFDHLFEKTLAKHTAVRRIIDPAERAKKN
jgi:pyrroline-5-carboxylate reductase